MGRRQKPASEIRPGLPADDLLKLRGRGKENIVAPTKVFGQDAEGLVCGWIYPDCTAILKRVKGRYRVAQVVKHETMLHA